MGGIFVTVEVALAVADLRCFLSVPSLTTHSLLHNKDPSLEEGTQFDPGDYGIIPSSSSNASISPNNSSAGTRETRYIGGRADLRQRPG